MKLVLLILFSAQLSFAATRLQFFIGDQNAMAVITQQDSFGNVDNDSTNLYRYMNVSEQNTMLGKGKAIISANREFQLVCSQYKNQCQVILSKAPNTIIRSFQKYMKFSVSGEQADGLRNMFQLDENGEFHFLTIEGKFRITAKPSEFVFEAQDK